MRAELRLQKNFNFCVRSVNFLNSQHRSVSKQFTHIFDLAIPLFLEVVVDGTTIPCADTKRFDVDESVGGEGAAKDTTVGLR